MIENEPIEQTVTAVSLPDPFTEEAEPIETTSNQIEEPATIQLKMMMVFIAAIVLLLDQGSKYLVEANLTLGDIYAPFPSMQKIFRITHVSNKGAAFGFFPDGSALFIGIAVLVAIIILVYNFTVPDAQRALRVALGLQLGGALGNLTDRIRIGHVTDFIDIGPWYIFNIADMAVVAGACVLGWIVWQDSRREKAMAKAELLVADALQNSMDTNDEW